jgi:hypothetical protein
MTPLTRDTVLFALALHVGESNGVRACDLVGEICGASSAGLERQLRHQIEDLRRDGQHVCGQPSTGYFIAANDSELLRTVRFLHDRAMTSLSQAAAMQRVSLPDLRGQLRLPHENQQAGTPDARPAQPAVAQNTGNLCRASYSPRGEQADLPTSRASNFSPEDGGDGPG